MPQHLAYMSIMQVQFWARRCWWWLILLLNGWMDVYRVTKATSHGTSEKLKVSVPMDGRRCYWVVLLHVTQVLSLLISCLKMEKKHVTSAPSEPSWNRFSWKSSLDLKGIWRECKEEVTTWKQRRSDSFFATVTPGSHVRVCPQLKRWCHGGSALTLWNHRVNHDTHTPSSEVFHLGICTVLNGNGQVRKR